LLKKKNKTTLDKCKFRRGVKKKRLKEETFFHFFFFFFFLFGRPRLREVQLYPLTSNVPGAASQRGGADAAALWGGHG